MLSFIKIQIAVIFLLLFASSISLYAQPTEYTGDKTYSGSITENSIGGFLFTGPGTVIVNDNGTVTFDSVENNVRMLTFSGGENLTLGSNAKILSHLSSLNLYNSNITMGNGSEIEITKSIITLNGTSKINVVNSASTTIKVNDALHVRDQDTELIVGDNSTLNVVLNTVSGGAVTVGQYTPTANSGGKITLGNSSTLDITGSLHPKFPLKNFTQIKT